MSASHVVETWEFYDRDRLKLILGIDDSEAWLASDYWVDTRDKR
jgi:hypothetical protein